MLGLDHQTQALHGRYVVTWTTDQGDGAGLCTKAQIFETDGRRVGAEFVVNSMTDKNEMYSVLAALPDGGFAIAYSHITELGESDPGRTDIYLAIFGANGVRRSDEDLLVETVNMASHEKLGITLLRNGHLVISWEDPVAADDANGGVYAQIVDPDVGPQNGAPTDIHLGAQSIAENSTSGAFVGMLSATDPDAGEAFVFSVADEHFEVVGNQLRVKNGAKLDFEQAQSHQITVNVTDRDGKGLSYQRALTISILDVIEALKGTKGKDRLEGGIGSDQLWGGSGRDILTGGAGKDIFVFDTRANKKTNVDRILDFSVEDDTIWLDNKVFTKLGKKGSEAAPAELKKGFFVKGFKAKDKNDHVIYDSKKGVLLYDADGSGKGKAVEIATLSKNLKITEKDFFVI